MKFVKVDIFLYWVDDKSPNVIGNRIDVQDIEMKQISTHFRAPVAVLYKAIAVSDDRLNVFPKVGIFAYVQKRCSVLIMISD